MIPADTDFVSLAREYREWEKDIEDNTVINLNVQRNFSEQMRLDIRKSVINSTIASKQGDWFRNKGIDDASEAMEIMFELDLL